MNTKTCKWTNLILEMTKVILAIAFVVLVKDKNNVVYAAENVNNFETENEISEQKQEQSIDEIKAIEGLQAYAYPDKVFTGKKVSVAIIDSGINVSDKISDRIIDSDYSINSNYSDSANHGTLIANTIASINNENVKIKSYKVTDDKNNVSEDNLCEALEKAIQDRVNIINISIIFKGYSERIEELINKADKQGIYVVVSSGNQGDNIDNYIPAGLKNVISVGAVNSNNNIESYSNTGKGISYTANGSVDYTSKNGSIKRVNGTSFASAKVTAYLAYIISNSDKIPMKVLDEAAKKLDMGTEGYDEIYGTGVLTFENVKQALKETTSQSKLYITDKNKAIANKVYRDNNNKELSKNKLIGIGKLQLDQSDASYGISIEPNGGSISWTWYYLCDDYVGSVTDEQYESGECYSIEGTAFNQSALHESYGQCYYNGEDGHSDYAGFTFSKDGNAGKVSGNFLHHTPYIHITSVTPPTSHYHLESISDNTGNMITGWWNTTEKNAYSSKMNFNVVDCGVYTGNWYAHDMAWRNEHTREDGATYNLSLNWGLDKHKMSIQTDGHCSATGDGIYNHPSDSSTIDTTVTFDTGYELDYIEYTDANDTSVWHTQYSFDFNSSDRGQGWNYSMINDRTMKIHSKKKEYTQTINYYYETEESTNKVDLSNYAYVSSIQVQVKYDTEWTPTHIAKLEEGREYYSGADKITVTGENTINIYYSWKRTYVDINNIAGNDKSTLACTYDTMNKKGKFKVAVKRGNDTSISDYIEDWCTELKYCDRICIYVANGVRGYQFTGRVFKQAYNGDTYDWNNNSLVNVNSNTEFKVGDSGAIITLIYEKGVGLMQYMSGAKDFTDTSILNYDLNHDIKNYSLGKYYNPGSGYGEGEWKAEVIAGSTVSQQQPDTADDTFTINKVGTNHFTRTGYTFNGTYTLPNGAIITEDKEYKSLYNSKNTLYDGGYNDFTSNMVMIRSADHNGGLNQWDVLDAVYKPGTLIQLHRDNKPTHPAQQWWLESGGRASDGKPYYYIHNASSLVVAYDGNGSQGSHIVLADLSGADNQKWVLEEVDGNPRRYLIRTAERVEALGNNYGYIDNFTGRPGDELVLWKKYAPGISDITCQEWYIGYLDDRHSVAVANYSANNYIITYDLNKPSSDSKGVAPGTYTGANSATNEPTINGSTTQTVTYDSNIGSMPTPTLHGWVFKGWKDISGREWTGQDKWKIPSNTTLYAQWEPITYEVRLEANEIATGLNRKILSDTDDTSNGKINETYKVNLSTNGNQFTLGNTTWTLKGNSTTGYYYTSTFTYDEVSNLGDYDRYFHMKYYIGNGWYASLTPSSSSLEQDIENGVNYNYESLASYDWFGENSNYQGTSRKWNLTDILGQTPPDNNNDFTGIVYMLPYYKLNSIGTFDAGLIGNDESYYRTFYTGQNITYDMLTLLKDSANKSPEFNDIINNRLSYPITKTSYTDSNLSKPSFTDDYQSSYVDSRIKIETLKFYNSSGNQVGQTYNRDSLLGAGITVPDTARRYVVTFVSNDTGYVAAEPDFNNITSGNNLNSAMVNWSDKYYKRTDARTIRGQYTGIIRSNSSPDITKTTVYLYCYGENRTTIQSTKELSDLIIKYQVIADKEDSDNILSNWYSNKIASTQLRNSFKTTGKVKKLEVNNGSFTGKKTQATLDDILTATKTATSNEYYDVEVEFKDSFNSNNDNKSKVTETVRVIVVVNEKERILEESNNQSSLRYLPTEITGMTTYQLDDALKKNKNIINSNNKKLGNSKGTETYGNVQVIEY